MNQILIIIHLLGLAAGFASGIGNAVIGARMASNPSDVPALRALPAIFGRIGLVGIGLLWATGLIMVWSRWGGPANMPTTFWYKITAVVIFTALVIYADMLIHAAGKGDVAAAKRAPIVGRATGALAVLIVILAVYSFS